MIQACFPKRKKIYSKGSRIKATYFNTVKMQLETCI